MSFDSIHVAQNIYYRTIH